MQEGGRVDILIWGKGEWMDKVEEDEVVNR